MGQITIAVSPNLSMTVSDVADPTQTATNTDVGTPTELFILAGNDGNAQIKVEGTFAAPPANLATYIWRIDGAGAAPYFGDFSAAQNSMLTPGDSKFIVKGGFDRNGDGYLADAEVNAQITVYIIKFEMQKPELDADGNWTGKLVRAEQELVSNPIPTILLDPHSATIDSSNVITLDVSGVVQDHLADILKNYDGDIEIVTISANGVDVGTLQLARDSAYQDSYSYQNVFRPFAYQSQQFLQTINFPAVSGRNIIQVRTSANKIGNVGTATFSVNTSSTATASTGGPSNTPGNIQYNAVPQGGNVVFFIGNREAAATDAVLTSTGTNVYSGTLADGTGVQLAWAASTNGPATITLSSDSDVATTCTLTETVAGSGHFAAAVAVQASDATPAVFSAAFDAPPDPTIAGTGVFTISQTGLPDEYVTIASSAQQPDVYTGISAAFGQINLTVAATIDLTTAVASFTSGQAEYIFTGAFGVDADDGSAYESWQLSATLDALVSFVPVVLQVDKVTKAAIYGGGAFTPYVIRVEAQPDSFRDQLVGKFLGDDEYHIVEETVGAETMHFFGQSPPTNFIFVDKLSANSQQIKDIVGDEVYATLENDTVSLKSTASQILSVRVDFYKPKTVNDGSDTDYFGIGTEAHHMPWEQILLVNAESGNNGNTNLNGDNNQIQVRVKVTGLEAMIARNDPKADTFPVRIYRMLMNEFGDDGDTYDTALTHMYGQTGDPSGRIYYCNRIKEIQGSEAVFISTVINVKNDQDLDPFYPNNNMPSFAAQDSDAYFAQRRLGAKVSDAEPDALAFGEAMKLKGFVSNGMAHPTSKKFSGKNNYQFAISLEDALDDKETSVEIWPKLPQNGFPLLDQIQTAPENLVDLSEKWKANELKLQWLILVGCKVLKTGDMGGDPISMFKTSKSSCDLWGNLVINTIGAKGILGFTGNGFTAASLMSYFVEKANGSGDVKTAWNKTWRDPVANNYAWQIQDAFDTTPYGAQTIKTKGPAYLIRTGNIGEKLNTSDLVLPVGGSTVEFGNPDYSDKNGSHSAVLKQSILQP